MTLIRDFKATLKARTDSDPEFRSALFTEVVDLLLSGDIATGKTVLRDFINARMGFGELAAK